MRQFSEETVQPRGGKQRQQIADGSGRPGFGDQQIIEGVEDHGQSQPADHSGKGEYLQTLRGDEPDGQGKNADDVHHTHRQPPDQNIGQAPGPGGQDIAAVFKGGKACADGDSQHGQRPILRVKHHQEEQQRYQLHQFLHHRREEDRRVVFPHAGDQVQKAADIGRDQAHPHAEQEGRHIAPHLTPDKEKGNHQRNGDAQQDVFRVNHDAATSFRSASSIIGKQRVASSRAAM